MKNNLIIKRKLKQVEQFFVSISQNVNSQFAKNYPFEKGKQGS